MLGDPDKRAGFDRFGGPTSGRFIRFWFHRNFDDIFGDLFGDFFGETQRQQDAGRGKTSATTSR